MLCACVAPGLADVDIASLTMGRMTTPVSSWLLNLETTYRIPELRDAKKDSALYLARVEHGVTDALTLEGGVRSAGIRRDDATLDRAVLGGRLLAVKGPVLVTPTVAVLPSLRGDAASWELGLSALRNVGKASFLLSSETEAERDPASGWEATQSVEAAALMRFGLCGLGGVDWEYKTNGSHTLALILGGSLSRSIFLSLEPRFGLTPQAQDFSIRFLLGLYRGPARFGGWGLDAGR